MQQNRSMFSQPKKFIKQIRYSARYALAQGVEVVPLAALAEGRAETIWGEPAGARARRRPHQGG